MKVADVMTTDVLTLRPDSTLKEAAQAMVEARVSGMPVLDVDESLAGILTEGDFVRLECGEERHHAPRLILFRHSQQTEILKQVGDLMTTGVITISPEEPLGTAARTMLKHGVKRLPVVDDNGELLGIVSRGDIMGAFARSDDDLSVDIKEHLEAGLVKIPPDALEYTVDDGIVTLRGEMENRSDAALVEHLVERLAGVVRVSNELSWGVDDSRPSFRWRGFSQEGSDHLEGEGNVDRR